MKNSLLILLIFSLNANAANYKGRLEWVYTVPMHVLNSTQVVEVLVDKFQKVKKGELLIRTRQDVLKAELALAKARVQHISLLEQDEKRSLDRVQELFDRGLTSLDELKKAELAHARAKFTKAEADAEVVKVQADLEHSEFKASVDSIVLDLNARVGQIVYRSTQPVIRIAPYKQMLARVLVAPRELKKYQVGQKAKIKIAGGTSKPATIYRVGFEPVRVESKGAIYEIDLIFDVSDEDDLRPSEVVTVELP